MKTVRKPIAVSTLRFRGSQESAFNTQGDLNASSKKDALIQIAKLFEEMAGTGVVSDEQANNLETAELRRDHHEMVLAAFQDPAEHKALGELITAELYVAANRQGFARRYLGKQDLTKGAIPMTRMRMKDQVATVATGPVQVMPQIVRDRFFFPPEFYISARPFIEQREIEQSSDDVLEEKYVEGLESLMVQEDRTWRAMANATVGGDNPLTTISGSVTPASVISLHTMVSAWNIPVTSLLLATDIWNDIAGDPTNWASVIDPVSKFELLSTGRLGTIHGMGVDTEAYRFEQHKVLEAGELFVVGDPKMHGQYTDRGGLNSNPIDGSVERIPGRGWWITELMSMIIANGRSVAKAIRS